MLLVWNYINKKIHGKSISQFFSRFPSLLYATCLYVTKCTNEGWGNSRLRWSISVFFNSCPHECLERARTYDIWDMLNFQINSVSKIKITGESLQISNVFLNTISFSFLSLMYLQSNSFLGLVCLVYDVQLW